MIASIAKINDSNQPYRVEFDGVVMRFATESEALISMRNRIIVLQSSIESAIETYRMNNRKEEEE